MSTLEDPAARDSAPRKGIDVEKSVRVGLAVAVAGVLVVALVPLDSALRTLGGGLLLCGWLAAAWGLHRYGRAG